MSQLTSKATARLVRSKRRGLTELLYQVGLVAPNVQLQDFMAVLGVVLAAEKGPGVAAGRGQRVRLPSPNYEEAHEKALEICLEDHPELAEYIRTRSKEDNRPLGAPWYWYIFIREAREKLYALIQHRPVSTGGGFVRIVDGKYRSDRDLFAEAIDELPADAVRECAREECRRIFLKKKPTQVYCLRKCGNVVNNRALRGRRSEGSNKKRHSKEDIEAVQRAISGWPKLYGAPFKPSKKNIRDLAAVQEITEEKCKEIVEDLAKKAGRSNA